MIICEIYAVVTVSITTAWVYFGKDYSLRTLALAMFFPGLFAPWFTDDPHFLYRTLGLGQIWQSFLFSLVAILCVLITIALVIGLNLLLGWGQFIKDKKSGGPPDGSADKLSGFLRAAGEEVGWRCYLLPGLINYYPVGKALAISGVVWGLFHFPVMVLLTGKTRVTHRWKTVVAQFLSTVFNAYVIGWLAVKSGYSIWAPAIHHFLWNRWVPLVFGSIYTEERGHVMSGQQWLINPEGTAGALIGLFTMFLVTWDLSRV